MLQNISILNKYCCFEISILQTILKKSITVWKNASMYKKSMFLEHQISILEWFLKDHVTVRTGVMDDENSALSSQEKIAL